MQSPRFVLAEGGSGSPCLLQSHSFTICSPKASSLCALTLQCVRVCVSSLSACELSSKSPFSAQFPGTPGARGSEIALSEFNRICRAAMRGKKMVSSSFQTLNVSHFIPRESWSMLSAVLVAGGEGRLPVLHFKECPLFGI